MVSLIIVSIETLHFIEEMYSILYLSSILFLSQGVKSYMTKLKGVYAPSNAWTPQSVVENKKYFFKPINLFGQIVF